MNKYWKTTSLAVLTVIILGIFYFQMSSYSERLPHFSFHKIEGDEDAVEPMLVQGDLTYSMLGYETFKVGANGTEYLRDQSFFERQEGYYMSEEVKQLREKHREFMRGKETYPEYFFENERLLAYADTSMDTLTGNIKTLTLDVLNKETEERKTFEVEIPKKKESSFVEVTGVRIVDDNLYVVAKSDEELDDTGLNTNQSIQRYEIDMNKEKLVSTETVHTNKERDTEWGYSDMNVILNDHLDSTKYIVTDFDIQFPEMDEETGEELGKEETVFNSMEVYDIVTNEKQVINPPKEAGLPVALIGNMLYLMDFGTDKMRLSSYDIEEESIQQQEDVNVGNIGLTYMDLMYQQLTHEGKFYFTSVNYEEEELPTIAVIDLQKMHVDYIGEVEMEEGHKGYKDPKQGMNPYEMYFGDIELKFDS